MTFFLVVAFISSGIYAQSLPSLVCPTGSQVYSPSSSQVTTTFQQGGDNKGWDGLVTDLFDRKQCSTNCFGCNGSPAKCDNAMISLTIDFTASVFITQVAVLSAQPQHRDSFKYASLGVGATSSATTNLVTNFDITTTTNSWKTVFSGASPSSQFVKITLETSNGGAVNGYADEIQICIDSSATPPPTLTPAPTPAPQCSGLGQSQCCATAGCSFCITGCLVTGVSGCLSTVCKGPATPPTTKSSTTTSNTSTTTTTATKTTATTTGATTTTKITFLAPTPTLTTNNGNGGQTTSTTTTTTSARSTVSFPSTMTTKVNGQTGSSSATTLSQSTIATTTSSSTTKPIDQITNDKSSSSVAVTTNPGTTDDNNNDTDSEKSSTLTTKMDDNSSNNLMKDPSGGLSSLLLILVIVLPVSCLIIIVALILVFVCIVVPRLRQKDGDATTKNTAVKTTGAKESVEMQSFMDVASSAPSAPQGKSIYGALTVSPTGSIGSSGGASSSSGSNQYGSTGLRINDTHYSDLEMK